MSMSKILVIEDDELVQDVILEILKAENYAAIAAENGHLGVQLAQKHQPDLIICDITMPDLDGHGALTALRQNPTTATIPFIFLSAKTSKAELRQGMNLGADDYLTKPFTRDELLGAITTRLAKKQTLEQHSQLKLNELRYSISQSLPHELHTPLTGILGCSELLLEQYDELSRDEALDMITAIHSSAERLYRLTQNFLLYTELVMLATEPEKLKALQQSHENNRSQNTIAEVANQVAQRAQRTTDLYLELQEATVQMPVTKLKKIVEELVDNAFKFSAPHTPVHLISFVEPPTFTLCILDHGRGMTTHQIEALGAYLQFDRQLYEQQGSGLGLSIAKRLTEIYGGVLTIESLPGEQTTVRIDLPLKNESAEC